jgi:hypothetical protein
MILSFSSGRNSTLALVNFSASRWQNLAVRGRLFVMMWYSTPGVGMGELLGV